MGVIWIIYYIRNSIIIIFIVWGCFINLLWNLCRRGNLFATIRRFIGGSCRLFILSSFLPLISSFCVGDLRVDRLTMIIFWSGYSRLSLWFFFSIFGGVSIWRSSDWFQNFMLGLLIWATIEIFRIRNIREELGLVLWVCCWLFWRSCW